MRNTKCVYVKFRLDGTPCYVGKGELSRPYSHEKAANCYKKRGHLSNLIRKSGGTLPTTIIRQGLSNSDALELERLLIKAIGRVARGGPLLNQTDGGEGTDGYKHTEETKKKFCGENSPAKRPEIAAKISANKTGKPNRNKGRSNPNRGKHRDGTPIIVLSKDEKEAKKQASWDLMAERMSGENNPMFGVPSPMTGKKHMPEVRGRISKSKQGSNNPMFGVNRPQTEEERQWRRETSSLLPGPRLRLKEWRALKSAMQQETP